MGLSSVKNTSYYYKGKSASGTSATERAQIAKNIASGKTVASSMLPNKNRVGAYVSARTSVKPGYKQISEISRFRNPDRLSNNVGLYGAMGVNSSSAKINSATNLNFNNSTGWFQGGYEALSTALNFADKMGVFNSSSKTTSNSQALETATSSLSASTGSNNISSEISVYVSAMSTAQTSGQLRTSIANANGQLSILNSQTSELQGMADNAQTSLNKYAQEKTNAETDVKNLTTQANQAKQGVDISKQELQKAHGVLTENQSKYVEARSNRLMAEQRKSDADSAVNTAQANVSDAQQGVSQAESMVASARTPAEKAAAQMQLNTAKAKLAAAQNQLKQAQAKQTEAETNLTNAKDAETTAQNNLSDAEKSVTQANEQVTLKENQLKSTVAKQDSAEQMLTTAKSNEEIAKKNYEDLSQAGPKFKAHQDNVLKLQSEIDKYNKKLNTMMEKEAQELTKTNDNINSNQQKIDIYDKKYDFSDTKTSKGEQKALGKKNDLLAENSRNTQKQTRLNGLVNDSTYITNMLNGQASKVVNGEKYFTGTTPSGETVYYRGNMPITKEMYDEAG